MNILVVLLVGIGFYLFCWAMVIICGKIFNIIDISFSRHRNRKPRIEEEKVPMDRQMRLIEPDEDE